MKRSSYEIPRKLNKEVLNLKITPLCDILILLQK